MDTKKVATLKLFVAGAMALVIMGGFTTSTMAQTLCAEEPVLGAVDSNGDGVATVEEILAIAPDNAELQAVVGQLQGAGYTGIQYTGCGASGGGSATTGGGTSATAGGDSASAATGGGTSATAGGDSASATTGGASGGGSAATGGGTLIGDGTGAVGAAGAEGVTTQRAAETRGASLSGEANLVGPDGQPITLLPSAGGGADQTVLEDDARQILATGFGVLGLLSLLLFLWSRTWKSA